MASFDTVNYSLRPSKTIERQLVFESVARLRACENIDLSRQAYIGLGSVWFTDFNLAHRMLRIEDMVSIEKDDIGFKRARFNAPFSTVRVFHDDISTLLPSLYRDDIIRDRPWLVWLDYDSEFDESSRSDISSLIEKSPENSILIATFNAHERNYGGNASDRPDRLKDLFGSSVPDDLSKKSCKGEKMQTTLAKLALDFMTAKSIDVGRPGNFIEAFNMPYRDGSPMVTVGGFLAAEETTEYANVVIQNQDWPCMPNKPIVAPLLTAREASALQSKLPCNTGLTRSIVQSLGFDLEEGQLEAFEKYYRHYPSFAQILA